jgi:1-phosphatidylinositol-3-phosphate 5-kinase
MISSSDLFERFTKHIETTTSDTRALFVSAVNKPEHLQTLLSELHSINKEVSHASNVLKNKIVSVTNSYNTFNHDAEAGYAYGEMGSSAHDAFCNFPWHARRYLFLLASAWNERLSAIGHAVSAMKKVVAISQKLNIGSRSDIGIPQGVGADGELDEVSDAMQRLKEVKELYADFNIGEMDIQSTLGGRREKKNNNRSEEVDDDEFKNDVGESVDDEIQINFSEEVDADVLASRRRASLRQTDRIPSQLRRRTSMEGDDLKKHKNRIPTCRSKESRSHNSQAVHRDSFTSISSRSLSPSSRQKAKAVSAGGAVKSALTRFFNRGGKEDVANIVSLGIFNQGRLRLEPGVGGVVIPVFDDQPSTIFAHSLASIEYESQFRRYTRAYLKDSVSYKRGNSSGPRTESKLGTDDLPAGASGLEKQTSGVSESSTTRRGRSERRRKATSSPSISLKITNDKADIEKRMLVRSKTHVKHTFRDYDEKGTPVAKFVCTTFWSTQFQAVRQAFLKENSSEKSSGLTYNKNIIEKNFVRSLSASLNFAAVGGKSGASFSKTADDRFIVKSISRTELQMFLDCAPAYFEYLSKAFFHGLPTMLCKIVGVFQIGYHNRETGKRTMEQVAVMQVSLFCCGPLLVLHHTLMFYHHDTQNIFFERNVSKVFDLKGSLRGRFAKNLRQNQEKSDNRSNISPSPVPKKRTNGSDSDLSSDDDGDFPPSRHGSDDEEGGKDEESNPSSTLLDGDFLEFTSGRPLPLTDRAKAAFHMSILNVSQTMRGNVVHD